MTYEDFLVGIDLDEVLERFGLFSSDGLQKGRKTSCYTEKHFLMKYC